jgi:hypothetical protein
MDHVRRPGLGLIFRSRVSPLDLCVIPWVLPGSVVNFGAAKSTPRPHVAAASLGFAAGN